MEGKEEYKLGANQWNPDPRQSLFLKYYLDRKSETFSNAYRSAIKAGYADDYAKVILTKDLDWVSESVRDERFIQLADKNLEELLIQDEDKKVKADLTKFVKSRLQKEKWSERSEITGPEGKPLEIREIKQLDDKALYTLAQGLDIPKGGDARIGQEGVGEETPA